MFHLLKRRVWTIGCYIILLYLVHLCSSRTQTASYTCVSDDTNVNNIIVIFRLVPQSDTIVDVFAYDAATGDTTNTANRKTGCMATNPLSAITDPTTEAVEFVMTVDTTSTAAHDCGVALTGTTVKTASLLFRAVAYANVISVDDAVYQFSCSSDDLNGFEVATAGVSAGAAPVINLTQPNRGLSMRVKQEDTDYPISIVSIGENVYITIEFVPGQDKGFDNWGTHFFVGFLGNDVISGDTQSTLFVMVQPRYAIDTYISVTSVHGTEERIATSRTPEKFLLSSDLMGCSEAGVAELEDKGVEITSSHEVGVLVYNTEADSTDVYAAQPVDVLGTDYYTVSAPAVGEVSEFMIIATEDDTSVDITLPVFTSLSVESANITKSAGETVSLTMQKRQVWHLAQTSDTLSESVIGYHIASGSKPVAVISGNRAHADDHIVEQIPATSKLAGRYVLVPKHPPTTYIVQATQSGDTILKRYTSETAFDEHTINVNTDPTLTLSVDDACELEADKSILVTQIVPTNGNFEPAMLVMPSTQQWSSRYLLYTEYRANVMYVFPSQAALDDLKVAGLPISSQANAVSTVLGPNGYRFFSGHALPPKMADAVIESTDAITLFMPLVYQSKNGDAVGMASLAFGTRLPTTGWCDPTPKQGNLNDDDCDGLIDEELINYVDDDKDGLVDEDAVSGAVEFVDVVNVRPTNCMVSGPADFSDANKQFQLTGSDGCAIAGTGPFKQDAECILVSGTSTERKVIECGGFEIAMFEDEPKLYFKCDIDVCYSSADTKCTTICSPMGFGKRKRQAENDETPGNVTTDVWVLPRVNVIRTETESQVDAMACFENTSFKIVAITLGLLSSISFITAICFCCLFRRNRNQQKYQTRHGKPF